jgi:hypothetical protein
LAEVAIFGLPVALWMRAKDGDDEWELLEAARAEAPNVMNDLMRTQAQMIIEEYAKAREKGAKKGKRGK